jgi:polar amino acid transport system permease protein
VQNFLHELAIGAWPLIDGFLLTLWISLAVIAGGSAFGFLLGIALSFGAVPLRLLIRAYVDAVRGTPVLVLILASYYLLAIAGVNFTAIQSGLFALSIFCSAHMAEIVRGALQSIPRTQIEAGRSIGLTFPKILLYVLLPQALLQILPVWINTGAELVKASTLLSIIGVGELLLRTQEIVGRNFMTLEFYALCGVLFFLINFALERLGKFVERRFAIVRRTG